jgi:hypothetical protein
MRIRPAERTTESGEIFSPPGIRPENDGCTDGLADRIFRVAVPGRRRTLTFVSDVTHLLAAAAAGDPTAADLLPLVDDELWQLTPPGEGRAYLQATALVHEAYATFIGPRPDP